MSKKIQAALIVLTIGLLACSPTAAQQTTSAEREAMYYRYLEFASYVKGGSIEPHWMADGSSFWYAEGAPQNTVIWKVDPKANTKTSFFDTKRLRRALTELLGHEPPNQGLPFDTFTFVDAEKGVKFSVEDTEFLLNVEIYEIRRAPPPSEQGRTRPQGREVLSPDGLWIATAKDYNLWLRSTEDGSEVQLTRDGVEDHEWSLGASAISGQDKASWSPDSSTIAAKKVDFRRTPKIPLVNWLGAKEEVQWTDFGRSPGQPIPANELTLIDVRSGKRVRVDVGDEPEQRIFLVQWVPDGSHLLFFTSRPYRGDLVLMAADAATGLTRVLLDEQHPVRSRTTGPFPGETPFTLLADGRRFVWLSGRTGWRHLYLYDLAGTLIRPLTQGAFPVDRVVHLDEGTGWVYFTAHGDARRPYDTHLYRVSLEGKGLTRLTEAPGQHAIRFAPSGLFFLDTHSSADRAPAVELRRADGKLLQTLTTANVDALKELKWTRPEEFAVKAADGKTDLYGVLYKPYDFDPDKKYPVILHAVGGDVRTFTGSGERETSPVWSQAIAQLGFITFKVSVREPQLSRRGGEFDRVTRGTIGRYEVPDYVAALKGLAAKRPYMDLSRVGIFGGSYSGYHAIRALLQAPDVFHVGVAVAAITDSYGHPNFYVLGSPEENRQAFEDASNLSLAGNLRGKLLLVHGTHDTSVPFSHAMKMVDALTRAGKPYDLIVIPGWGHWWPDTEQWERYRLEAIRRYFQEHLKPVLIAFSSQREGNREIYVMGADGSALRRLTPLAGRNRLSEGVRWSPDRKRILFYSNRDATAAEIRQEDFEIYVMDADGSNIRRLTQNAAWDRDPAWSPDGSRIVFSSGRDGSFDIYVMEPDGGNLQRLTYDGSENREPDWSPDGRQIAFSSSRDGNRQVYVMDADGSNVRRLTHTTLSPSITGGAAWSPDGFRIAFYTLAPGAPREGRPPTAIQRMHVMDRDGSNPRLMAEHPGYRPRWSQDGTEVVFQYNHPHDDYSRQGQGYEIHVMSSDGTNVRRLTINDLFDAKPDW